jgi:hypothetical protein
MKERVNTRIVYVAVIVAMLVATWLGRAQLYAILVDLHFAPVPDTVVELYFVGLPSVQTVDEESSLTYTFEITNRTDEPQNLTARTRLVPEGEEGIDIEQATLTLEPGEKQRYDRAIPYTESNTLTTLIVSLEGTNQTIYFRLP